MQANFFVAKIFANVVYSQIVHEFTKTLVPEYSTAYSTSTER